MAYIGRGTENISNVEVLDNLTFDGSASYTLQKSSTNFVPSSANNLLISISGVVQQGNFSVSGSTITFDTTVSASDTCDWILHYGTGLITTVADGAITEAKLGSNAVTTAKINNGAITSAKLDSGLGLGKIGQVVQGSKSTQFDTSSTSFVDTGLSVSITPSSTSSKVLLMSSTSAIHIATTSAGGETILKFYRNTTAIGGAYQIAKSRQDGSYNQEAGGGGTAMYLDSPSSTSAISYKVYIRISNGNGGRICQGGYTDATITAMEVLA